jgi:hypothetical protein
MPDCNLYGFVSPWSLQTEFFELSLMSERSCLVRVSVSHLARQCKLGLCAETGKYQLFGLARGLIPKVQR